MNWKSVGRAATSAAPCGSVLHGGARQGQSRRSYLWRDADIGTSSPSLRGQYALPRPLGRSGRALLRHVAGRPVARNYRASRPPLVHRRAIPSGIEVAALRTASLVCQFHRRGGGTEPARLVGLAPLTPVRTARASRLAIPHRHPTSSSQIVGPT